MKSISFGVCGLGRIGYYHYGFFSELSQQFQPVACCDLSLSRAQEAAKTFGGRAYDSLTDFLQDPALELVIVATRSLDHVSHASQALQTGKTVLLEKPIGVTHADYLQLQQLVRDYPGKLFFGHNHRFEPAHVLAHQILSSGLLGKLHTSRICKAHDFMPRCDWQMEVRHGGGQLSVWGPHVIDQTLHFLNAPVNHVWAHLATILTPGDADDHCRLMLETTDGTLGEIEISGAVALPQPYCELCGDRGALRYEADQQEIQLKYLDPDYHFPSLAISDQTPARDYAWDNGLTLPWITETRKVPCLGSPIKCMELSMADCLWKAMRKQEPYPITSQQALEVVRITELAKQQNPHYHWL